MIYLLQFELIDTLWNVNSHVLKAIGLSDGINRYIMECKWRLILTQMSLLKRINRYIMECKCPHILS